MLLSITANVECGMNLPPHTLHATSIRACSSRWVPFEAFSKKLVTRDGNAVPWFYIEFQSNRITFCKSGDQLTIATFAYSSGVRLTSSVRRLSFSIFFLPLAPGTQGGIWRRKGKMLI